jgi:hypothetical protein
MNYLIYGDENNWRFEPKPQPLDIKPTLHNMSEEGDHMGELFEEREFTVYFKLKSIYQKVKIEYSIFNKNIEEKQPTIVLPLDNTWLKRNYNMLLVSRESGISSTISYSFLDQTDVSISTKDKKIKGKINDEDFEFLMDQDFDKEYTFNLVNYKIVKMYLEYEDMKFNCVEYKGIEPTKNSFLVGILKVEDSMELELIDVEVKVPMGKAYYIVFRNERDEKIPIEYFVVYAKKKVTMFENPEENEEEN